MIPGKCVDVLGCARHRNLNVWVPMNGRLLDVHVSRQSRGLFQSNACIPVHCERYRLDRARRIYTAKFRRFLGHGAWWGSVGIRIAMSGGLMSLSEVYTVKIRADRQRYCTSGTELRLRRLTRLQARCKNPSLSRSPVKDFRHVPN